MSAAPRAGDDSSIVVPGGHLLANWVRFGGLLRRLGFSITPERLAVLQAALAEVDLARRSEVQAAARSVLVSRRREIDLFDRAFDLFFRLPGSGQAPAQADDLERFLARFSRRRERELAAPASGDAGGEGAPLPQLKRTYSAAEILRHKDFARLTRDEEAEVRRLIDRRLFVLPPRRTRRRIASAKGRRLDLRRTLRASLRQGGEPLDLTFSRRKLRPRPIVVLADVSGSMEPYSRLLLKFLYAVQHGGARRETFVFGTRLTRLTRQLSGQLARRDADRALAAAAAAVVDWGGGTRIGEILKRFNYDWARRVLGRGAVVLVVSDGWDRGDPKLLARETARLQRRSSRLIWANPLLDVPGYEPLTRGLLAALPHVDDFLPIGNLASLEQLALHLERITRPTRDLGA